jgi:hypothetical protein
VGFALLWLPAGIPDPSGSVKLADDYGETLTNQQRNRLNQRTGLDFSADTTIQEALETILFRSDTLGWKALRPTNGRYEAWLGSSSGKRKWIDTATPPAGGSISDNFTRANETPIASPWVELSGSTGNVNLASNAITHTADGDFFLYYSHGSGWNADQSSQWQYVSEISADQDWGPAVRVGSNGFSGYFYDQYDLGRLILKFVAGSASTVETASGAGGTGVPYKIDATGSTIRYYDNGTENANSPVTDTSLTTAGNGAGVFFYGNGGSIDAFLGTGEVTAGANPKGPLSNPLMGPFGGPI